MKTDLCQYVGDYTFNWNQLTGVSETSSVFLYSFKIVRDAPEISDHKFILIEIAHALEKFDERVRTILTRGTLSTLSLLYSTTTMYVPNLLYVP